MSTSITVKFSLIYYIQKIIIETDLLLNRIRCRRHSQRLSRERASYAAREVSAAYTKR